MLNVDILGQVARVLAVTLNVSLIVPDGIVIGCDSLLTVNQPITQQMNVNGTCPKCNENVEIKNVQVPPVNVPSSTFPYAQKLFPIKSRFAMAVYGMSAINGRSVYSHSLEINAQLPQPVDGADYLETVKNFILNYFDGQFVAECQKHGINPLMQPDGWFPFGCQLVGFSKEANGDPIAKIHLIQIGKGSKAEVFATPCYVTGDISVVLMLWPTGVMDANTGAFSLQDAIDYVRFLIRTTSDRQRFSGRLPTVGGEIDIALVTARGGFKWIAQKELYRMLEKENV